MEQENISYSDTSAAVESDGNNRPEKPNDGGAASARSYDCSFCKRGFTNAQALGGHMNIHRKDKEKAKAKKKKSRGEEDPLIQSFFPQVYMPPTNPSLHRGSHEYCFFPSWRPDNLQDRLDGSLSSRFDEDEEEEVDLELRLGRIF